MGKKTEAKNALGVKQSASAAQFNSQSDRYGKSHILADTQDVEQGLRGLTVPASSTAPDVATGAPSRHRTPRKGITLFGVPRYAPFQHPNRSFSSAFREGILPGMEHQTRASPCLAFHAMPVFSVPTGHFPQHFVRTPLQAWNTKKEHRLIV